MHSIDYYYDSAKKRKIPFEAMDTEIILEKLAVTRTKIKRTEDKIAVLNNVLVKLLETLGKKGAVVKDSTMLNPDTYLFYKKDDYVNLFKREDLVKLTDEDIVFMSKEGIFKKIDI